MHGGSGTSPVRRPCSCHRESHGVGHASLRVPRSARDRPRHCTLQRALRRRPTACLETASKSPRGASAPPWRCDLCESRAVDIDGPSPAVTAASSRWLLWTACTTYFCLLLALLWHTPRVCCRYSLYVLGTEPALKPHVPYMRSPSEHSGLWLDLRPNVGLVPHCVELLSQTAALC